MTLSDLSSGIIVDRSAQGTILNDDFGPPVGLVSYWAAEDNASDSQGRNDGVELDGATYGNGQVNRAFVFDGIDDRIEIADSQSLALTRSLTIEGWVRVDALNASAPGVILFRGDNRGGLDPYQLRINTNGTIQFSIQNANNESAVLNAEMPREQFVHVAATLDDATGELQLYLNSVLVASTTTNVRPFADLDPNSHPSLRIGYLLDGIIDELKLYDIPLTQTEIESNFEATKGSLTPSISISDTTVVEGNIQFNFTEDFVSPDAGGIIQPRGISYGPDGNLYISSSQTDSILRYDGTTGAFIDEFVPTGTGGLDNPRSLEFRDGFLYVASSRSNAVLRFDASDGSFVDEFVSVGSGGLIQPRDVLFGTDNDLYVTSGRRTRFFGFRLASCLTFAKRASWCFAKKATYSSID